MNKLYPDLYGANPLARSRRVDHRDIQSYQQFGMNFFVNRRDAHVRHALWPKIKTLLDVFVQRIATKTVVYNKQQLVSTLMDWPHLNTHLRSGETVDSHQDAQDMKSKLPTFWITMKHLVMREMKTLGARNGQKQRLRHNESSATQQEDNAAPPPPPSSYTGSGTITTLDKGGDCHRQPIVKITQDQLNTILAADVCFVTAGSDKTRQLECSSRGMTNTTTLLLATTSQDGIVDTEAYHGAKKLFKPCGSAEAREGRANNTKIYTWNAQTQTFRAQSTRDETSLSKRVRISPIWNMLARLRGTSMRGTLTPLHAWAQTETRRHDNPRWDRATTPGGSGGNESIWDAAWVFRNTDPQCSARGGAGFGSIARGEWYNNPEKHKTCLEISEAYGKQRQGCQQQLANSFDICQIDHLKDFCYTINNLRAEIRGVNAWANQYTHDYKNLYLPSRYMKQDGMFGWSAIVQTYSTINPALTSDVDACPGIQALISNVYRSREMNTLCPANAIFEISKFLETVRGIVVDVVEIIVLCQQVLVDGFLFFLAVLGNEKEMIIKYVNAMMSGLFDILQKLLSFYKEMLRVVWDIITAQDGVFKSIADLIKNLCNFAKKIVLKILGAVESVFKVIDDILNSTPILSWLSSGARPTRCLFLSASLE